MANDYIDMLTTFGSDQSSSIMESYHTYSFEKLEAWQLGRQLKMELNQLTCKFPSDERFGYISQIRRAASSITVNLAEGSGRASFKDQAYFTNIAIGSLYELVDHLIGAKDMGYINETELSGFRKKVDNLHKLLAGLHKSQLRRVVEMKGRSALQPHGPKSKDIDIQVG